MVTDGLMRLRLPQSSAGSSWGSWHYYWPQLLARAGEAVQSGDADGGHGS